MNEKIKKIFDNVYLDYDTKKAAIFFKELQEKANDQIKKLIEFSFNGAENLKQCLDFPARFLEVWCERSDTYNITIKGQCGVCMPNVYPGRSVHVLNIHSRTHQHLWNYPGTSCDAAFMDALSQINGTPGSLLEIFMNKIKAGEITDVVEDYNRQLAVDYYHHSKSPKKKIQTQYLIKNDPLTNVKFT